MIRMQRSAKTVEDYMQLPDDVRAELIHGELLMSPSPKQRHQRIVSNIHFALRSFVEGRRLGRVFDAPLDVHLPTGDIVQPDVLFIAANNRHIIRDWIRGAPDLLVEVISADNPERDRIIKRDIYAQSGVREYWIVDDSPKSVEVFELVSMKYEPRGCFERDDTLRSPVLPEFELRVTEVFAE